MNANVHVVHKREPHDVYIGRPGILGNPYTHIGAGATSAKFVCENREAAIAKFEEYAWERMQHDTEFRDAVLGCDGKTVGCWCRPRRCHGDTLARLIDKWYTQVGD